MEKNKKSAQILYYDLYGKREEKFSYLLENNLQTVKWTELHPAAPDYFFVPKDFSLQAEYEKGFKINELFNLNGVGICSKRDETAFQFEKQKIELVVNDFNNLTVEQLKEKYNTEKTESRDKQTAFAKNNIQKFGINKEYFQKITYRPFDTRWTYFTNKSKGFLAYPVYDLMQHFTKGKNIGLVVAKTHRQISDAYFFVTVAITDLHILDSAADATYIFPLCLWKTFTNNQNTNDTKTIETVNLNKSVADKISEATGLQFMRLNTEILDFDAYAGEVYVKTEDTEKLFDYIYAVLHSRAYRKKYKEFLKIDFPRIPYPENAEQFIKMACFGEKLRKLHLMEGVEPQNDMADFPVAGSNEVEKPKYVSDKVYINEKQYFDNVPSVAWNFYIGGYQPAQKWLKDRKGRTLNYDDTVHYQKIIWVLKETEEVMREVDEK